MQMREKNLLPVWKHCRLHAGAVARHQSEEFLWSFAFYQNLNEQRRFYCIGLEIRNLTPSLCMFIPLSPPFSVMPSCLSIRHCNFFAVKQHSGLVYIQCIMCITTVFERPVACLVRSRGALDRSDVRNRSHTQLSHLPPSSSSSPQNRIHHQKKKKVSDCCKLHEVMTF